MKSGLVVVQRKKLGLLSSPAAEYGGFDGAPWPLHTALNIVLTDGLARIESLDIVQANLGAHVDLNGNSLDVVLLRRDNTVVPNLFQFRGYDAGQYDSEYSCFSSILNEVLLGTIKEMTAFVSQLNSFSLFPSAAVANELLAARQRALATGADLESVGHFEPIAIYGAPLRTS